MNYLDRPFQDDFPFPQVFILILGALFFIPLLGNVHLFDWDEINFAESAREMIVTGNYTSVQINFVPFWEKPPLFFWLQSLSMHVFGINEFAARFPNAVCGILTLLVIYKMGKDLYNHQFGMLWSILYLGALLPHLYFKSGIIDPLFNLFIFLSIWNLIKVMVQDEHKNRYAILAGLFVGLAILTKGPVGLLIVLLTFLVYWISVRLRRVAGWQQVLLMALSAFLVSSLWFGPETLKNGPWFISEFIEYQIRLLSTSDAGHRQPIYYHFVVVLIGCFPFSVFAIRKLITRKKASSPLQADRWMRYLFWVVMILFTIVKTKIVHYSSMAYLPLSFLATLYISECINHKEKPDKWILYFNLVVGVLLSLMIIGLAILLIRKDWLTTLITHPSLSVDVPMVGFEYLIGLFYLVMTILVFILIIRNNLIQRGLVLHAIALGITLFLSAVFVVPKVEAYSQRPAIGFYQSLVGKDVYVYPLFKTYAHYFYARISPDQSTATHEREWFLSGDIDKPVYLIEYTRRADRIQTLPEWELLYREGDFSFFRRDP